MSNISCSGGSHCAALSVTLPHSLTLSLTADPRGCPVNPSPYCWAGGGSDNHGDTFVWIACRDCLPFLPSARIKGFARQILKNFGSCDDLFAALADDGATTPGDLGDAVSWLATAAGSLCFLSGDDTLKIWADPPDGNYQVIATPLLTRRIRVSHAFPAQERALLQKWLDTARESTAMLHGLRVSLERAEGADVAHDGEWTLRQLIAASGFAHRAAKWLRSESRILVRLRKVLGAGQAINPALTVTKVRQLQRHLKRRGFPEVIKRLLARFGATRPDVAALQASLVHTPARELAGRVFSHLSNPSFVRQLNRLARALDVYSTTAGKDPLSEAAWDPTAIRWRAVEGLLAPTRSFLRVGVAQPVELCVSPPQRCRPEGRAGGWRLSR